jgi:hypothetical protein
MLGEFFAARDDEIDDALIEDGPFERLETVEAKGLSEVNFATLGEILGLGAYDDLVDRFDARGPADNDEVGLYRLPPELRDALAGLDELQTVTRRWAATDEFVLNGWRMDEVALVLDEVRALARRAREQGQDLWYWWSL